MKFMLIAVTLVTACCVFAQQPQADIPTSVASPAENGGVVYFGQAITSVDFTALYPSNGEPIAVVLSRWAKKFGQTVVVEPSLTTQLKSDPTVKAFEQGLDQVLKPYENVTWRKVYLRAKAEQPNPNRLAAMVRTMVSMEATGIIVP